MAAGPFKFFGAAALAIAKGDLDLDTNIRMALVTSGWTPDQSANDTWSDVSANEVAEAGGYETHGKAVTMANSRTGLVTKIDCNDQVWDGGGGGATITAKYAVLVRDADGNEELAAGDQLIAFCDLNTGGGSLVSTAADFTVQIHEDGIATLAAA